MVAVVMFVLSSTLVSVDETPAAPQSLAAERASVSSEIADAKKKGVGTKPYEDELASIDHDMAAGQSEDSSRKRLASVSQALKSQIAHIVDLRSSVRRIPISISANGPTQMQSTVPEDERLYVNYMKALQRTIKRNWHPAKGNESRHAIVRFKILRNGSITNLQLWSSSGNAAADEAALEAVKDSAPLPFPHGSKDNDQDIEFTFDYNVHGASTW